VSLLMIDDVRVDGQVLLATHWLSMQAPKLKHMQCCLVLLLGKHFYGDAENKGACKAPIICDAIASNGGQEAERAWCFSIFWRLFEHPYAPGKAKNANPRANKQTQAHLISFLLFLSSYLFG